MVVVCKDGVPGSALTWDWSAAPPWQKKQLGERQFSPKSAWGTISMLIQERCGTWGRYFNDEACLGMVLFWPALVRPWLERNDVHY